MVLRIEYTGITSSKLWLVLFSTEFNNETGMKHFVNIRGILLMVTRKAHDDVIKWKHFPRNWSFVRGIHRSPVNSPHKGQWRGALMISLICVWINDWVNNREAGDWRRYRAHYDVIVMSEAHQAANQNWVMPQLLTWPGHQQSWYCSCRINRFLITMRNYLSYLCFFRDRI